MNAQRIEELAEKYQLDEIKSIILSTKDLVESNFIDVAVLGQFKAGKSSLINSIIGKDVLPTGVIPVTAIISRIFYSPVEQIIINFLDGNKKEVKLSELKEYITESLNPQNSKQVESADIALPEMEKFETIRLIDTPGLGSIFANNTETTQVWSPQTTIALIVISAERPLSEEDKKLLEQIKKFSYKTYCVLTKADLFDQNQLEEIKNFVHSSLQQTIGGDIPVLTYSIKQDTEIHKQKLYQTVFEPLIKNSTQEINNILNYKLLRAALLTQNYLKIALQASIKSVDEQRRLKEKIFNSQTSANFLYQQIQLIASDLKTKVRPQIEQMLLPHKSEIQQIISQELEKNYYTWQGNLYKISRKYEKWLKQTLSHQIKQLVSQHKAQMDEILVNAAHRFSFFTENFTQNLKKKILDNLGVEIQTLQWQAQMKPLESPDISVYRAFDSNIDLLWFLFPMFIFKKLFYKQFAKQIPLEVEKNIYRTISILTGIVNAEIEKLAQQSIVYINQYIDTISKALSIQQQKIDEIKEDLAKIEKFTQIT